MASNKKERFLFRSLSKLKGVSCVAFFALAFSVIVLAQGGPTGAITGTVKDAQGGVVPGASVRIINQKTGVAERELVTNDTGDFTATLLPVAIYRIEVTLPGFSKAVASDINVRVTETASVAMKLEVGEITQTVNVIGAQAPVQLSAPTTGETIQNAGTLPLATRNFLSLLALSAGANTEMADTTALGRGQVTMNVNGQRAANNNYQLEGINANDYNLPVLDNVALPNPQTVQEFKTQTSLYDASQGRNGGGNVQVTLKSGTSKYHGDAFEFFRNNDLNANDWFLNRAGRDRPVLRQNQFGGSLGGPIPIAKNFFFFLNYQGTREASAISAGTTINTTVPVLPSNRSAANLQSTFFPNGLPPGSTGLDPVALAVLNLPASKCAGFNDGTFCLPSLAGTPGLAANGTINVANLSLASLGTFNDDQFTVNIDKQFGQKDKISGRWFFSDFASNLPFGTQSSLPFALDQPSSNRFLKLGWTHELSTSQINDVRFGFSRYTFKKTPTYTVSLSDVGATSPNQAFFPEFYQVIVNGGGGFRLGPGVNDNRGTADNTFEGADDYSWTKGKHTLRFGGEVDRYQLNRFNNFAARGDVTFANTVAGLGGPGVPALSGFQNFLLGRVNATQVQSGIFLYAFRATNASAYFQDDWKIFHRLTLNLGLRWEGIDTAHDAVNNALSNFGGLGDGAAPPLQIIHPASTPRVGTPGVSDCTLITCFSSHNFAPRFGFAWDVFGDHKTALRGGYGIYYITGSNQALLQSTGGAPFQQPLAASPLSVTPENPFPTLSPQSAFPLSTQPVIPLLSSFDPATGAPIFNSPTGQPESGGYTFAVRDFRPPYTQQWNLTFERSIYHHWVAQFAYVGTRGSYLLGPGYPLNPGQFCTAASPCIIPATSLAPGATVPAGTPGTFKNADGSISLTQSTAANINARVPTQYLGLANGRGEFTDNGSSSTYHAAQFTLSHQYSAGLYFQAAYTYSRALDNGSGSAFTDELNGLLAGPFADLLDPRGNRALSNFDRTHRLSVSYQYELPFARWMKVADHGVGKLANGWSFLGNITFQSGTPFTVIDTSALTLQDTEGFTGVPIATLASGNTLSNVNLPGSVESRINNYINMSAFQLGGSCVNNQNAVVSSGDPGCTGFAAIGNVPRNVFRGPFQQNWDMSFIKVTKITEQAGLEFRAEFFNIFNHPAFQSPQASGQTGFAPYDLGNYGIVDLAGGTSSILATVNRPRIIQFAMKLNF